MGVHKDPSPSGGEVSFRCYKKFIKMGSTNLGVNLGLGCLHFRYPLLPVDTDNRRGLGVPRVTKLPSPLQYVGRTVSLRNGVEENPDVQIGRRRIANVSNGLGIISFI